MSALAPSSDAIRIEHITGVFDSHVVGSESLSALVEVKFVVVVCCLEQRPSQLRITCIGLYGIDELLIHIEDMLKFSQRPTLILTFGSFRKISVRLVS